MIFKFRGKSIELDMWVEGSLVNKQNNYMNNTYIYCPARSYVVYENTIGMFSGIYDIHEKEIYSGDIIKYGDNDMYSHIAEVKFTNGQFIVCSPFGVYSITDTFLRNKKVIGNIIDNPDIITTLKKLSEEYNCAQYLDLIEK